LVRHAVSAIMMLSLTSHASAAISRIVAFGDSLSDTGNLFSLTAPTFLGGYPPEPYYNGRFSNGLLAVEAMAFQLGVPVTSYAYGGAQTGPGNEIGSFLKNTGVSSQISKYTVQLYGQAPAADTLFFLWAGPNDFYTGNNMLNASVPQISSTNMVYDIHALYNAGARNLFVPLMPDLSATPEALGNSATYRAAARDRTVEFNKLLVAGIANLEQTLPGLNITIFDTPTFMQTQLPLLESQGFNITDACYNESLGQVCANADKYVFWDQVHPTTATDWLLGSAFVAAATAVPEPGTSWLMLVGTITVLTTALQRRRKMVAVCARPSSL
jgi:phospholipase/lecithinase/hemolysin